MRHSGSHWFLTEDRQARGKRLGGDRMMRGRDGDVDDRLSADVGRQLSGTRTNGGEVGGAPQGRCRLRGSRKVKINDARQLNQRRLFHGPEPCASHASRTDYDDAEGGSSVVGNGSEGRAHALAPW